MRDWLQKLRLKLLYRFAKAVAVEPFLEINTSAYCPACGHRDGEIQAVPLEKPDQSNSTVGVAHKCNVCKYEWVEASVSIIKQHLFDVESSDEEKSVAQMTADKRTKTIRTKIVVGAR